MFRYFAFYVAGWICLRFDPSTISDRTCRVIAAFVITENQDFATTDFPQFQ